MSNERIPFFSFTQREHGIDAEASATAGYDVPKMETFIHVLAVGMRDASEHVAKEWIAKKEQEARNGRYEHAWVAEFREGLSEFLQGRELPRNGTPTFTWERLAKARREQLAPQFPTVEDLAAVPDSSLGMIGMDGRVVRDMARGDIQAKKDLSPVVKELALANARIAQQDETIVSLTTRLESMESVLKTLTKGSKAA